MRPLVRWPGDLAGQIPAPGLITPAGLVGSNPSDRWPTVTQVPVPATVMTIDTTITDGGSSSSTQFALPIYDGGTYDFSIDWGDGSTSDISAWDAAAKTHTYAAGGQYRIVITGSLTGWRFNSAGDAVKILEIDRFHSGFSLGNLGFYLYGCANMARCGPFQTSGMTTLQRLFSACNALEVAPYLPTGSITSIRNTFENCTVLRKIPLYDFSSAVNAIGTFINCTALDEFPPGLGLTMGSINNFTNFLNGTTLTTESYSLFLQELESVNGNSSVAFHGGGSTYDEDGATARAALIADHSWSFTDGGPAS